MVASVKGMEERELLFEKSGESIREDEGVQWMEVMVAQGHKCA